MWIVAMGKIVVYFPQDFPSNKSSMTVANEGCPAKRQRPIKKNPIQGKV
jgi:hypothetical protein